MCLIFFYAFLRNILHSYNYLVSHTPEAHRNAYRTLQNCLVLLFYFHQNLNMSTDFSTTMKYQVYENHFSNSLVTCREVERHGETSRCRCATFQCHKKHHNSFFVPHPTIFWFLFFKIRVSTTICRTGNNYNTNKHVPKLFIFRYFNTKICMTGQEKCVDFFVIECIRLS